MEGLPGVVALHGDGGGLRADDGAASHGAGRVEEAELVDDGVLRHLNQTQENKIL